MDLTDALPPLDAVLPLQQSPEFARALRDMGRPVEVLSIRQGARRIGVATLITRTLPGGPTLRFCSHGPYWLGAVPFHLRRSALQRLRDERMVMANAAAGDAELFARGGYLALASPATVAEFDLTKDWRKRASGKWRNALTRAEHGARRLNLAVTTRPFDPFERDRQTVRICAQMARKRGYRDLSPRFTEAFARANPGAAQIFRASLQGEDIAAVVILRHCGAATYHLGWTSDAGRATDAHRLLLASAADWLIERGKRRLDLGTIDTVQTPGLARFKLGMGAAPVQLGGTWIARPVIPFRGPARALKRVRAAHGLW